MLSRYPLEAADCSEWKEIPKAGVKAICQLANFHEIPLSSRMVDHLCVSPKSVPEAFACPTTLTLSPMEQLTTD